MDGGVKYDRPLEQITDLAGVRIIAYTLSDVDQICQFLQRNFTILEKTNVGDKRFEEGKFGYQSIHFLVKYPDDRAKLPEFSQYAGMTCEVQVRTVLQHAWAEIEHDIQYKNQSGLPSTLSRKFVALAGLLEIADREFQSIQDLDSQLKKSISDSLQEELTRGALAETGSADHTPIVLPNSQETSVRQLARLGRYDEAVKAYDKMILAAPTMHTLYIGRSRAKFLMGDRAGAMTDVDHALQLNPNDDAATMLRLQLDEGLQPSLGSAWRQGDEDLPNKLTRQGNECIEAGDGAGAFEYYSQAQEEGASRPFSLMNKAIACVIARDFEGVKIQLGGLALRQGTPFAVCLVATYCVVYAISEADKYTAEIERLRTVLKDCEHFSLPMSPLAKLQRGIGKSPLILGEEERARLDEIFHMLDGPDSVG